MKRQAPLLGWQSVRRALTGPRAVSRGLYVGFMITLVARGIADLWVVGPVSMWQFLGQLLLMAVVTAVVMTAAAKTWLRRRLTTGVPAALTIVTYAFISLALCLVIAVTDHRSFWTSGTLTARAITGLITLAVLAIALDVYARHQIAMAELRSRSEQVRLARVGYAESVERMRRSLLESADLRIGSEMLSAESTLADLRVNPTVEALRIVADQLRSRANLVIRSLSHAIARGEPGVIAESVTIESSASNTTPQQRQLLRRAFRRSIETIASASYVRPFWASAVALYCLAAWGMITILRDGPRVGVARLFFVVAIIWLAFRAADRFLTPVLRRRNAPIRVVAVLAIYLVVGLGTGLLVPWTDSPQEAKTLAATFMLALVGIGSMFALLAAVLTGWQSAMTDLQSAVATLSWHTERLRQDEAGIRQEIARLLHGSIQSRLIAVALQLDVLATNLEDGRTTLTDPRVDRSLAEAHDALAHASRSLTDVLLVPTCAVELDLGAECARIITDWAPVVDVRIECDPATATRVNVLGGAVVTTVVGIVRESVTNAVRHGRARRIEVSVVLFGDDIEIRAVDHGAGVRADFTPGLGIAQMRQLGATIHLSSPPTGGTELVARLPITTN
ncbi:MAG: ATP-binding protein [Candidatus Nanopelagicales bacterium]